MNSRNKYVVVTVRTLLGLFLIFSGVTGFMALASGTMEGVPEPMQRSQLVLAETGIFHMIKATEIIVGLMLVTGFLPWLATLFFAPLAAGIIVYNSRIAPQFLPFAIPVILMGAFLGYVYWGKYKRLFERKWEVKR